MEQEEAFEERDCVHRRVALSSRAARAGTAPGVVRRGSAGWGTTLAERPKSRSGKTVERGAMIIVAVAAALVASVAGARPVAAPANRTYAPTTRPEPYTGPRIVVLLVGLEGSGHHFVMDVMKAAGVKCHVYTPQVVIDRPGFDGAYLKWYDAQGPGGTRARYVVHSADSFPEGRVARRVVEIRHPSLTGFKRLNDSRQIDLRLVELRRDPVAAVCSALRRFHAEVGEAGRVASDSLSLIECFLKDVPHTTVCYKAAAADPAALAPALAPALRGIVSEAALLDVLRAPKSPQGHKLVKRTKTSDADCVNRAWLETVLATQRNAC